MTEQNTVLPKTGQKQDNQYLMNNSHEPKTGRKQDNLYLINNSHKQKQPTLMFDTNFANRG